MALILDYPTSNYDSSGSINQMAQTFTAPYDFDFTSVKFYLGKETSGSSGAITAYLYATVAGVPTGTALASSSSVDLSTFTLIDANIPPTNLSFIEFTFSTPYACTNGTVYGVSIEMIGDNYMYGSDDSTPTFDGGYYTYDYFLEEWLEYPDRDSIFEIYGTTGGSNSTNFFQFI